MLMETPITFCVVPGMVLMSWNRRRLLFLIEALAGFAEDAGQSHKIFVDLNGL